MVVGESGTGKELIAQFLHQHSRRASRSLVPINCAALPEQLLESEMFGHRKGAFTGADRDKIGLLEMANGGTFFLDELTEMPLAAAGEAAARHAGRRVRRVGSEQQDAVVDVRFISATNRDPREAIRSRTLREDLYLSSQRLPDHAAAASRSRRGHSDSRESFPRPVLGAPPLTERCAAAHRATSALDFLMSRPWRGNVRELQNVIEHVVVLAQPGSEIQPDEIPVHQEWTSTGGNGEHDGPAQRRLPHGEGAGAGDVREGVRHEARGARIGQHVARGAARERRPDDVVSAARAPRVPP